MMARGIGWIGILAILGLMAGTASLDIQVKKFPPERKLAAQLPARTLLYAEVPAAPAYAEFLSRCQVPPVAQLFVPQPFDVYAELAKSFGGDPESVRFVLKSLKGLSFVLEDAAGSGGAVVILEMDSPETAQKAARLLAPQGPEIFRIRIDAGGPRCYAMAQGSYIVLAENQRHVGAFAKTFLAGPPARPSLAESEGFKTAVREVGDKSLVWAFCSAPRALEIADREVREQSYQAMRQVLGLQGLQWACAGLVPSDKQVRLHAEVRYDETVFRGAALLPKAEELKILAQVPGQSYGCAALTLNDPQAWWTGAKTVLKDALKAVDDEEVGGQIDRMDALLGLSDPNGAFAQLQGQAAVLLRDPAGPAGRRDWVALVPVKDGAQFQKGFEAVCHRLMPDQQIPARTVQGISILEISPDSVFVGVTGRNALVSGTEEALASMAACLNAPRPQQPIAVRARDVEALAGPQTLAAVVNAGTLFCPWSNQRRDSGEFDAFIAASLARQPGRVSVDITIDRKLMTGMMPASAMPLFWLGVALPVARVHSVRAAPPEPVAPVPAEAPPPPGGAAPNADLRKDMDNLRAIGAAWAAFRADHDALPATLADLVPKYLKDANALVHPADAKPEAVGDQGLKTSYVYLGPVQFPPNVAAQIVIAYTRPDLFKTQRACLGADGHVVLVPEQTVRLRLQRSHDLLMAGKPDPATAARIKKFCEVQ